MVAIFIYSKKNLSGEKIRTFYSFVRKEYEKNMGFFEKM
jgi:hypothetical protein